MIRTRQADHVCRWGAVFKCLRLPRRQNQVRRGKSLCSLTHLGARTVIHPLCLSVRDGKDYERGNGNIGVLLHAFEHHRFTREIALLSNSSVRSRRELLSKLSFGIGESKCSQASLLQCGKTGQTGIGFAWRRSFGRQVLEILQLLHCSSRAVIKGVWIPSFEVYQPSDAARISRSHRTQLFSAQGMPHENGLLQLKSV